MTTIERPAFYPNLCSGNNRERSASIADTAPYWPITPGSVSDGGAVFAGAVTYFDATRCGYSFTADSESSGTIGFAIGNERNVV
jgi:hypothetical protein